MLSLIVPCYNEQEALPFFYRETTAVLAEMGCDYELLFVNDGQYIKLSQNVGDAVARRLPKGPVDHIFFIENYRGKTILRPHFSSREHHAAHTVKAADIDLMRLWNLHADVHNVPVFMHRRVKLQLLREKRSCCLTRRDDRTVDMFQHEKHSPATAFASARYSSAI